MIANTLMMTVSRCGKKSATKALAAEKMRAGGSRRIVPHQLLYSVWTSVITFSSVALLENLRRCFLDLLEKTT